MDYRDIENLLNNSKQGDLDLTRGLLGMADVVDILVARGWSYEDAMDFVLKIVEGVAKHG